MSKENRMTLKDYILYGGIQGRIFSYGKTEPMIYRVEDIENADFLRVVRIDRDAKGQRELLSIPKHIDD